MTTLRDWLADEERAGFLLDARIVKATVAADGKVLLLLDPPEDEEDDEGGDGEDA